MTHWTHSGGNHYLGLQFEFKVSLLARTEKRLKGDAAISREVIQNGSLGLEKELGDRTGGQLCLCPAM